jgi:hypothetical protein
MLQPLSGSYGYEFIHYCRAIEHDAAHDASQGECNTWLPVFKGRFEVIAAIAKQLVRMR